MKSKKIVLIGLILVTLMVIFWCGSYLYAQGKISLLPADNDIYTMELGTAIPSDANAFIDTENTSAKMLESEKNVQLVYTDEQLVVKDDNTTYLKVGDYEGTVKAGSKSLPFILHITDTTAPAVTLLQENLTFDYGTDLSNYDWNQHVSVTDLDETNITVDQAVDTSTSGSYVVKYTAVDSSGNSTEKELMVVVNEKPVSTTITSSSGSSSTSTKKNTYSENSSSYSGSSSHSNSGSSYGSSVSNSSSNSSSGSTSNGLEIGKEYTYDGEMQYSGSSGGSYFEESDWIPIP